MTDHPAAFERLLATGRYQRFTYDCYPYAQLASGQVDAVIDCHLQPYDYLPVAPVVEGAGGVISDWQGRPLGLKSVGRVVAAASAEIHSALLEILASFPAQNKPMIFCISFIFLTSCTNKYQNRLKGAPT